MKVTVNWSVMEGEEQHMPPDASTGIPLPDLALLPQKDDVVFISPRSAWLVLLRDFQQLSPEHLQVNVWLQHAPELLVLRAQRKLALVQPPPATQPARLPGPRPPQPPAAGG